MQTVIGILIAIFVFSIMIFLHELGHYVAARLCHVKVLEFAVGMGPKLFSRTSKKTGIVYSVRALPIGGFTAMQGEDGEDPDPGALVNRPRWQKLIVLFAGSFMNLLSGVLAMFIFVACTGVVGSNIVHSFGDNAVSNRWLKEGDEIVSINGKTMVDYNDIINTISLDGTEPLDIVVLRDGNKVTLNDVVFETERAEGLEIGVLDFRFKGLKPSFPLIVKQTVTQSVSTVKVIYKTLAELVSGKYGMEAVSGPVGTVSIISEAATSRNFQQMLYLFAFISLNLGLMNLLPLPALDGGRIVFVLIEMILRRPLSPKVEGYIHLAGMAVLLCFIAFITVFDVLKFF